MLRLLVEGIDFALNPGATISGRVTDAATGLPIGNLRIKSKIGGGGPEPSTNTDRDGRYVLDGLGA